MNIEQLKSLHAEQDDIYQKIRRGAFEALIKKGLPTIRSEEWRYTNLLSFDMEGKKWPLQNDNKKDLCALGVQPVYKNSIQLVICDCQENELVKYIKKTEQLADIQQKELSLLNASFLGGAREIVIPEGEIAQPIEIFYFNSKNAFANNNLNIIIEKNAQAVLVEHFISDEKCFANYVTKIELKDHAVLHHCALQNEARDSNHVNTVEITAGEHAIYKGFALGVGAKTFRRDIDVNIKGEYADVSLSGANLVGASQHMDATLITNHDVPHCHSNQHYKTILKDDGKGVFQGKIAVARGSDFTEAHQLNNALLLSDKAQMNAKPELIIYADEVQCSHGATTGQLDEGALFYLRSRGLSQEEAKMLLVEAFVGEVLNDIEEETCADYVREMVLTWLQKE